MTVRSPLLFGSVRGAFCNQVAPRSSDLLDLLEGRALQETQTFLMARDQMILALVLREVSDILT